MSICANHWHLLLQPRQTGDMGRYMQRLTVTHVRRWHEHRHSTGGGHVYQGTYKSFPVQTDDHFLTVARHVERNARTANLVEKAQDWQWCSLWRREHPDVMAEVPTLATWPVACPRNWRRLVNQALNKNETEALQQCIQRGRPYGSERWQKQTATRLDLSSTFRPRGRPRKEEGI